MGSDFSRELSAAEAVGRHRTRAAHRHYTIVIQAVQNNHNYQEKQDWVLVMEFHCEDLLQTMKDGLVWTTANVATKHGWLGDTPDNNKTTWPKQRKWYLGELPKSWSNNGWVALFTMYGHSSQQLGELRLHTLTRENVRWCYAARRDGSRVFSYTRDPASTMGNFNLLIDELHPRYGSWWFWPSDPGEHCSLQPRSVKPLTGDTQEKGEMLEHEEEQIDWIEATETETLIQA